MDLIFVLAAVVLAMAAYAKRKSLPERMYIYRVRLPAVMLSTGAVYLLVRYWFAIVGFAKAKLSFTTPFFTDSELGISIESVARLIVSYLSEALTVIVAFWHAAAPFLEGKTGIWIETVLIVSLTVFVFAKDAVRRVRIWYRQARGTLRERRATLQNTEMPVPGIERTKQGPYDIRPLKPLPQSAPMPVRSRRLTLLGTVRAILFETITILITPVAFLLVIGIAIWMVLVLYPDA
ncbi:MAG: hypothetical protein Q8P16_00400 [bacterium]|nr:hypothetical protein [bacterium]